MSINKLRPSGKYNDIINLPRPVSQKHPQMSLSNRAAQFAPFSALTGYGEAIVETARQTEQRKTLDRDAVEILNRQLMWIAENIFLKPTVKITYFVADKTKSGGRYITATEKILKIDYEFNRLIGEASKFDLKDIIDISII